MSRTIGALCAALVFGGVTCTAAQADTHGLFHRSAAAAPTTLAVLAERRHLSVDDVTQTDSVQMPIETTPGTTLALTETSPSAIPPVSSNDVALSESQARAELRDLEASVPPGAALTLVRNMAPRMKFASSDTTTATAPMHRLAVGIVHRTSAIATSLERSAMRFIGTPYVFGGTSPSGFDCSGYVQHVFAMIGVHLPRTADVQYYAGRHIEGEMLLGDLVFFQTYEPGPSHVGIYLGNGHFIHSSSHGVMVSSLHDSYWAVRYLGAKRVAKLH